MSAKTYLSRMNSIRSFAKRPRLDKHENPKSARAKKNTPSRFWNPGISFLHPKVSGRSRTTRE